MTKPLSRRTFLVGMPTATLALTVLHGCKEGKQVTCTNVDTLGDADKKARTSSQYIESSKIAAKNCDNCAHYVGAPAADQCGTCKVVKGPINPKGYCNLWVEKPA